MNFQSPEWLLALIFAPLLILAATIARRRRQQIWQKIVAHRLKQRLVTSHSSTRHWLSLSLSILGFCLLVLAAARPYYGTEKTTEKTKHRNLMLVLDVSRSMLCQDVQPNRLKASAALSIRLLNAFEHDRIGIVAFAGGNLQIAPLTIDHSRLQTTISQLDQNTIGIGGSDVTGAIKTAVSALKKTGQQANAIVVISDGEHHEESLTDAAKFANKADIQIFTVGVGNEAGGTIPDTHADDGKYRDQQGNVVHTRFHADVLEELARLTEGQYSHIHDRPETMIEKTLRSMKSFEQDGEEREIANELYHWFLLPSLIFFLASLLVRARWRASHSLMHTMGLLLFAALFTPQQAEADWQEWFQQKKATYIDQEQHIRKAQTALTQENYSDCLAALEKALKTATGTTLDHLHFTKAEALFRTHKYSEARYYYSLAMASPSPKLSNNAQFNMANSLFQQGWSELKPPEGTSFQEHMQAYFQLQQDPNKKQWNDEQKALAALPVKETVARWTDSVEHFAKNSLIHAPDNQKHVQELLDIIKTEEENAKPQESPQQQDQQEEQQQDPEKKDEKKEQSQDKQDSKDKQSERGPKRYRKQRLF